MYIQIGSKKKQKAILNWVNNTISLNNDFFKWRHENSFHPSFKKKIYTAFDKFLYKHFISQLKIAKSVNDSDNE